jgi:hypothetical protein
MPVALFFDPARGCRVLTARRLTAPTYTVALNIALQALFGAKGVPLTEPSKNLDGYSSRSLTALPVVDFPVQSRGSRVDDFMRFRFTFT